MFLKRVSLVAAVLALVLAPLGCKSTGEPDWKVVAIELELAAETARDAAWIVTDPDHRAAWLAVANQMDAAAALAALDPSASQIKAHTALNAADELAKLLPDDQAEVARMVLLGARAALRRYQAYAVPTDGGGD